MLVLLLNDNIMWRHQRLSGVIGLFEDDEAHIQDD